MRYNIYQLVTPATDDTEAVWDKQMTLKSSYSVEEASAFYEGFTEALFDYGDAVFQLRVSADGHNFPYRIVYVS